MSRCCRLHVAGSIFEESPLFLTCSRMRVDVADALRNLGAQMKELSKRKAKLMAKAQPLHLFFVDGIVIHTLSLLRAWCGLQVTSSTKVVL